jgi:hypothetical protein
MELKLDRKDIEQVLIAYANGLVREAKFNRIEWDNGYRTLNFATFDHTDIPHEKADE